ncbi:D-alanyl-D-alanine carboxypeptidase [Bifidobacterium mongoliense]
MAADTQDMGPGRRHRVIRSVLAAAVTAVLCAGYVVGDLFDTVPGPLTMKAIDAPAYERPRVSLASGRIVGNVARGVPIDAAAVRGLVDRFGATQGLGQDYSVAIVGDDGDEVAGHDETVSREPASTLKTLTALAAASKLDMGSTFPTRVYLNKATGQQPTLTLVGGGDMLLGAGASDPAHVNGRAGLATLADRAARGLRARGITSIRLDYDDTLFGTVRSPASIARNNPGNLFFTPISSMAIDGGRQWRGPGPANPDVFEQYPELSAHTAADVVAAFTSLLGQRGIDVRGGASAGTAPDGISPLATVHSATLGEVMSFMLRHSDNTLAEEFGRLLAIHERRENTPTGAVSAVTATLRAMNVDLRGLTMADCTGLSPGSQATASVLARVQAHNLQVGPGTAAATGLSIPGEVGTAFDRLADPSAAGLLRVKTGSLDSVTAMTGNVSRKRGGTLAFAVIVNNAQDLQSARDGIDEFVAALAGL